MKTLENTKMKTLENTSKKHLQKLFNIWVEEEIESDNDAVINIQKYQDLDKENKLIFKSFVKLVIKYPNIDKKDLSILNSIGLEERVDIRYEEHKWNNLDKEEYEYILHKEFKWNPLDIYEIRRMQKLAGLLNENDEIDYVVLDVKVGDKVKFYIDVPLQNIGTTGKKLIGTVTKINPSNFTVKDKKGEEHKISKKWHKYATYLPSILK